MSQEKVDRYKKEKANRQTIMKREKRKMILSVTAVFAVIAALAVWFGVSVYQSGKASQVTYYEADYTVLDNYINGLSA